VAKIALIQDGTEVTRQRFADVSGVFQQCCGRLGEERFVDFSIEQQTDDEVVPLLDGVDPEEWSCLVFASNALQSEAIAEALKKHRADVHRYLAEGGGLVVLYQARANLSLLLPRELRPTFGERLSERGVGQARAADADDILVRYPCRVPWETLRDYDPEQLATVREEGFGSELQSLFHNIVTPTGLPSSFKKVLVTELQEVIVARTYEHVPARIVVATLPLDWQSTRPNQSEATGNLLLNAIRFAALGVPKRLVWRERTGTRGELLLRWLSTDGGAAVRPEQERGITEEDEWLLTVVDTFLLPGDRLRGVLEVDAVREFLGQGGTVIASETVENLAASRIEAHVGRFERRELTTGSGSGLYGELRAVSGWRTVRSAFDLRNIVSALAYLEREEGARRPKSAITIASLRRLRKEVRERLLEPRHQEDLGSSIAHAETLAHLMAPDPVDEDAVSWLEGEAQRRPFDVRLQIQAVLALGRSTRNPTFVADAAEALAQKNGSAGDASIAPVVRVLGSLAVLHEAGLLEEDAKSAAKLARLACEALGSAPFVPGRGWLSVEATAELTRGLVALHGLVSRTNRRVAEELARQIALGATALRRAHRRYTRGDRGVSTLARLVHGLLVADKQLPIGLQRLTSLDWPGANVTRGALGGAGHRSLLDYLAEQNERLEVQAAQLTEQIDKLRLDRRPAALGRALVTSLVVAAVAIATWFVMGLIGWGSVFESLANFAVLLAAALTLLKGAFWLLDRLNLLSRPAAVARDWVDANLLGPVGSLGRLKRPSAEA
jgi:hypothetical protein